MRAVRPDHIGSVECCTKHKMLRHLQTAHGIGTHQHSADYGLTRDLGPPFRRRSVSLGATITDPSVILLDLPVNIGRRRERFQMSSSGRKRTFERRRTGVCYAALRAEKQTVRYRPETVVPLGCRLSADNGRAYRSSSDPKADVR